MSAKSRLKTYKTLLCLFVVAMGLPLFAQSDGGLSSKPRYAEAKFDKLAYDFGEIQKGEEAIAVFMLINQGSAPLVVENITASCGCTIAHWDQAPLMPQDTTQIKVSYNSNIVGEIKRSLVVKTNDRRQKRIRLTITGSVVSEEE
jgi:hypothetical protein